MNGDNEMMALVAAIDGDMEFELSLGELVGKWLRKKSQAITDAEAARLLPLVGIAVAVERQGCHRSTMYRRVSRAAKVARQMPGATK